MSHIRFSRLFVFAALAVAMMIPVSAAARVGIGLGFYGPVYPGGYYGPYAYGAYGYGPYGYYGSYGYPGRPLGEVRIMSPDSKAQIFINGALAGRAHDLKRFYLAPGAYNLEQRIGNDVQKQRVYVIANRTLRVEFGKPDTQVALPPARLGTGVAPQPASAPPPVPDVPKQ
jgi:hypothetical protein